MPGSGSGNVSRPGMPLPSKDDGSGAGPPAGLRETQPHVPLPVRSSLRKKDTGSA